MRRRPVLVAVPHAWEAALVAELATSRRVEIVRRCADAAELVSAAAAGLGEFAVVATGLRGMDRSFLGDLARFGVAVLGVSDVGREEQERRLRQLGVSVLVRSDAPLADLERALELAATTTSRPAPDAPTLALGPVGLDAAALAADADLAGLIPADLAGLASGEFDGSDGVPTSGEPPVPAPDEPEDAEPGPNDPYEGLPLAPRGGSLGGPPGVPTGGPVLSGWRPRGRGGEGGAAGPATTVLSRPPRRRPRAVPASRGAQLSAPERRVAGPAGGGRGLLLAVWGPTGAPGRSALALNLASEAAHLGQRALLIDADPYGGVQAQALSLLDDVPGLAAAVRAADAGDLDLPALATHCRTVSPGLMVLTGIARPDRWPELRSDPLGHVLTLARSVADVVVVDCGFCLEEDEELSYDTLAPRRNAATVTALRAADRLVVVGAADPIGLQRLTRGLADLDAAGLDTPRTVVVNRVRSAAVGARPEATISRALERFAGVRRAWFVPEERATFDRALLAGRTLAECAPGSPARRAVSALAAHVIGVAGDGGSEEASAVADPRGAARPPVRDGV